LSDEYHWPDLYENVAPQEFVKVNGEVMITGEATLPMGQLYRVPHTAEPIEQVNIPFWPRNRINIWGNHELLLKAEFLFFWIPLAIIWSLAIPCFAMLYMSDEAIFTTMTVKVIGRQWYWIYEVESPTEEEEDSDE